MHSSSSSPYELAVLRAMLRLARHRSPADLDRLLVRVGGAAGDVRHALRRLESVGFVERRGDGLSIGRLTMTGFAVAVAAAAAGRSPRARAAKTTKVAAAGTVPRLVHAPKKGRLARGKRRAA